MAKKIFRGVHGTSLTRAKSIAKNGLRPTVEGRAGAGGYLWSYITDPDEAIELATDWHADQRALGEGGPYAKDPEKSLVLLFFEIELEQGEVVNINTTGHHELIRKKLSRAAGKSALSKAYDDHIKGMSEAYKKLTPSMNLKMVEAMVSFPTSTKDRRRMQVPLTPGGDCYIVLHEGLSQLKLVGVRHANLTDAQGQVLKGM